MRPTVVLLLVLAAVAAFVIYFVALKPTPPIDNAVTPGPAQPTPTPQKPVEAVNLDPRNARETPPTPVVEEAIDDDEAPAGQLNNSLVGMVVNDKNEPVAGAKVKLSRDAMAGEAISIQWFTGKESSGVPAMTTTSDEKGRFKFTGIQPSREYYLLASHPDFSQIQEDLVAVTKNGESRAPDLVLRTGSKLVGTVVDAIDNAPIANARLDLDSAYMMSVEVASPDRLTVFSDNTGHFEFKSVAYGAYNLMCSQEGWGLQIHHSIQLKGDPNETIEQSFRLTVGHPIGGRVFGPDDEPVKGCKLTAINYGNNTSSRGEAITDDQGNFLINGLEAGAYILMIETNGLGYRQKQQNRVQADEVNLQIAMIRQGSLTGRVSAMGTNQPLKKFNVQLLRVSSQQQQGQPTYEPTDVKAKVDDSPDGSFELKGVDPGTYALKVTAKEYAARVTDHFAVIEGQQPPPIVVGLSQGGSIRGRIVDGTGAPVASATVTSRDDEIPGEGLDAFIDGLVATRTTVRKTRTNSDGFFELKLLNPGKYKIEVEHANFTLETVRNLVVMENKQTDAGQTAIKSGGTIQGRVLDQAGKPLARGWVRIFNAAGDSKQERTDTEGRYKIEHVMPGQYTLGAQRTAASGDPFQGIVDQQASEVQITVVEGQTSNRDINIGN